MRYKNVNDEMVLRFELFHFECTHEAGRLVRSGMPLCAVGRDLRREVQLTDTIEPEAGEDLPPDLDSLTQSEAALRIDELQKKTGRSPFSELARPGAADVQARARVDP